MTEPLKILCIHGLGDHRDNLWIDEWRDAINRVFAPHNGPTPDLKFVSYDRIFEKVDLTGWETMKAVSRLLGSGIGSVISGQKGVFADISHRVKWTAGYVVAWVEDDDFQKQTRALVLDQVLTEKPDVILAHSLGSLVAYNAFTHPDAAHPKVKAALSRAEFVSFGSQIANPFVVGNLSNGRVEALPVKKWWHLYNRHDEVFTAPIRLWDVPNFEQVDTEFHREGVSDHSAVEYLSHDRTIDRLWLNLIQGGDGAKSFAASGLSRSASEKKAVAKQTSKKVSRKQRPDRRALLVGINEYPEQKDRLEGCVNDVFLMSSVLQECGFEPEEIRICLDNRATAKGILDRFEWLLDMPKPGDERIFYYSGHGARIPEYGVNFEPDRHKETLVPWDFDWSPEHSVLDEQLFSLYGQLPYEMRFAMILDCCHSGGMHRQGGAKVRGISPPDDIRHRELKWDKKSDMWVSRNFQRLNKGFTDEPAAEVAFFGANGATTRIGRGSLARVAPLAEYKKLKSKAAGKPVGPYLPLIIEACSEEEFSYEYRHGATSYGAFTYALSKRLRASGKISFDELVKGTQRELADLGYQQTPQILGPTEITSSTVPWVS